ncbi:peptide deformylase [Candidatus Kaiserbacteria bacterium]|nr:peptide deformylase [Candidatus Kaiserbacteria bacterium]
MKEIVQDGDLVLREKAHEVLIKDITSDAVVSLLKDMREALEKKEYGVALAAPQIGVALRIFIVADRVFNEEQLKERTHIFVNPTIIKTSKKTDELEEACLSVEGYFGTTTRAQQVTVEAYNEHGIKFTRGASGLLAQIFQHEIDHLNGILYIDHARNVREVVAQEETGHE